MRNIWVIAKREYKLYFDTPLAYAVALIILFTVGVIVTTQVWTVSGQTMAGLFPAPEVGIIVAPMMFFFVFLSPALTMRLISDEIRMGTMELLLTAPLRDHELVIGKWLGAFLFTLSVICLTLIYAIILNSLSSPSIDPLLTFSIYLGGILVIAAFLAIGTAVSSMFSNPIAAYIVTITTIAIFWWFIGIFSGILSVGSVAVRYFDLSMHFSNFLSGNITISNIVYPLSLTVFGLFVATLSIETRRWR
jgi:ABC-2 type transport system permease protein